MFAWAPELAQASAATVEQLTYDVKYAGYIQRQQIDIERQQRLQDKQIPPGFDFGRIGHLRAEAREKLSRVRPLIWPKPAASAASRRPTWRC